MTEGQIYRIRDFSPAPFHHHHVHHSPFGFSSPSIGFGAGHAHHQHFHPHMMQVPRMLYLFTSHQQDYKPFWSDNPSAFALPEDRRGILRDLSQSCAWLVAGVFLYKISSILTHQRSVIRFLNRGRPEMYIDYIQLSEEDFT